MTKACLLLCLCIVLLAAPVAAQDAPAPLEISPSATWGFGQPYDIARSSQTIAVASASGVWLFDAAAPDHPPRALGTASTPVMGIYVAFNPANPDELAVSAAEGIALWSLAENRQIGLYTSPISGAAVLSEPQFSADGRILSARDGVRVMIWDVHHDQPRRIPRRILEDDGTLLARTALSPDGTRLFAASTNQLTLWDTTTGALLRDDFPVPDPNRLFVSAVAFSPDNAAVAAGDVNGHLYVWSLVEDTAIYYERPYSGDPATPSVNVMRFLPDGRLLTGETSAAGGPRLWQIEGGTLRPLGEIDLPDFGQVNALAVAEDTAAFVMLTSISLANQVQIVTLDPFAIANTLPGFEPAVSLAVHPNGHAIITEGATGLRLLSTADGRLQRTLSFDGQFVENFTFSPDGSLLAACANQGSLSYEPYLVMWDLNESDFGWRVELGEFVYCYGVFFRENRPHVLTSEGIYVGGDGRETPRTAFTLTYPYVGQTAYRYSAGGDRVAYTVTNLYIRVHDLRDPLAVPLTLPWLDEEDYQLYREAPVALDSTGTLLARRAGESVANVEIYTLESDAPAHVTTLLTGDSVSALAFVPGDPTQIITAHFDHSLRVWDVNTRALRAVLRGSPDVVYRLAFSADAAHLYTAGRAEVIQVWPLESVRNR